MGLRESKKRRVRALIIENAIALFRERGFDATPVREIAAAAEISDAPFFNYFPTKDAVLSSWVHGLLDPGPELLASADAYRSLRRPLREWARELARRIGEEGEFMALAWSRLRVVPPGEGGAPAALVEAFREGQRRGEVRGDVPPEQLASLLVAGLASTAAARLAADVSSSDPLDRALLRSVDLLLDGSRKRHERVRVGASRGAVAPAR